MNSISVVIPSLGNFHLLKTINVLNSGTIIPDEILLCVPENTKIEFDLPKNSSLVYCSKRSQVAQRAIGFKKAQYDFVLQLDDDTHLDNTCLENLIYTIVNSQQNCAVAPVILNIENQESIYKNEKKKTIFNIFKNFLANGLDLYKPGTVTKVGTCFGPNVVSGLESHLEVDWLAGCCVLHKKSNLIYDDYFPFGGKGYNEDLIASFLYKKKSVVFYINKEALCYTAPYNSNEGSFYELLKDLRSKEYYMSLSGRLSVRFYIFSAFKIGFYVFVNSPKRLINKVFTES